MLATIIIARKDSQVIRDDLLFLQHFAEKSPFFDVYHPEEDAT